MPEIVAAAVAESAVAETTVAATQAAMAEAAAAEATRQATMEATRQAAMEEAKRQAIQQGTQQMAQQAATQATTQATTQAATQQGLQQAGQQVGTEALQQGLGQAAQPLPPAGQEMTLEQQLAQIQSNPTDLSQFPQYEQVATNAGINQTPLVEKAVETPASELPQYLREAQSATPEIVPQAPTGADAVKAAQASSQQVSQYTPEIPKGISADLPVNPLRKGFEAGLDLVKNKPFETGLGLMSAGQYLNKPEEPDKDKYKSKVNMSNFQPSVPVQQPFTRSYEWQGYAVGGPVERMAAMNAVGANTGYPQANLQTPLYSNPAIQRPQSMNVIAPSADAGVDSYTGEPRFAEGGLSESERKEYGLSTRKERAARGLSQSYSEEEKRRMQDLEKLKSMGDKFDEGIIPRSRTQQLTSPYSAAMTEYARLAKKSKVPVVEMPKTNLGDIDNYMDTPLEAAQGGIMHGLGGYSDGGRLLKGPGDGVSDSIPAVIGHNQPARLADGEFVIPARIVSELGNGSTEAGARKLYAMMERVQAARKKSMGKKKVAVNSKADKHLPA